ncbi:MAG TPA: hypothetical protein VGI10_12550 [Polyangiaceae bacterium]|jgi:putative DNA primase/helicase
MKSASNKHRDEDELLRDPDYPRDPEHGTALVRHELELGVDLSRNVDKAIKLLGPTPVFQRQGALVDVVREAVVQDDGVTRPTGTPRIRLLPPARLKEMLAQYIDFKRKKQTESGAVWVSVPPPADLVAAIAARGEWERIRPLTGIADYPVLRADGSVLATAGYDQRTALLCEPSITVIVKPKPTQADARAAVAALHDLVADFPFAAPVHRTAWLSALLTLLARPAIDGPTPLVLIDASERGTGKTLLADVIGMICRGKKLPRRTAPEDAAEWKKAMLAIAIAADPVVLIDNVTRMLKSDALDAVLTGTAFRERVLGRNEELSLDVRTLFVVTANNAILSADLIRRSVHARLEPKAERPDQRSDFRRPDLLGHVRDHRAEYLAAGLTILRGYFAAGRPTVDMKPMGSYEAWSSVVRASLVWAGEPDIATTQDALRENSDPEHEDTHTFFAAWHAVYGDKEVTVRRVMADLIDRALDSREAALRDAISVLCDTDPGRLPSLRKLGNKLRGARGRVINGIVFERPNEHSRDGATWRTRKVGCESGDSGDSAATFRAREGERDTQYRDSHESLDSHDVERDAIQGELLS